MPLKQLADQIGITQPGLSKIESQDDMHIATLRKLLGAIGGKLELSVHLPDGEHVSLKRNGWGHPQRNGWGHPQRYCLLP